MELEAEVTELHDQMRLDVFLAGEVEDASRSYIQKVIKTEGVRIGDQVCKRPSRTVNKGELVKVTLPPAPEASLEAEDIPLNVLFEDDHVLVVNKPAGLVVHPAPGNYSGTLVNAALHHCGTLAQNPDDPTRPGIVHRLDRDTSGVMILAKSQKALHTLGKQAREHTFNRRYVALVRGDFKEQSGRIVAAVGRSLTNPGRMAVTEVKGKDAVTHFTVKERFGIASLVSLQLETGRTHQIRVHMRFAGHPTLGDPLYGVTEFDDWPESVRPALEKLKGQALHAELLGFTHPASGDHLEFIAPLPKDFANALEAMRQLDPPTKPPTQLA